MVFRMVSGVFMIKKNIHPQKAFPRNIGMGIVWPLYSKGFEKPMKDLPFLFFQYGAILQENRYMREVEQSAFSIIVHLQKLLFFRGYIWYIFLKLFCIFFSLVIPNSDQHYKLWVIFVYSLRQNFVLWTEIYYFCLRQSEVSHVFVLKRCLDMKISFRFLFRMCAMRRYFSLRFKLALNTKVWSLTLHKFSFGLIK